MILQSVDGDIEVCWCKGHSLYAVLYAVLELVLWGRTWVGIAWLRRLCLTTNENRSKNSWKPCIEPLKVVRSTLRRRDAWQSLCYDLKRDLSHTHSYSSSMPFGWRWSCPSSFLAAFAMIAMWRFIAQILAEERDRKNDALLTLWLLYH